MPYDPAKSNFVRGNDPMNSALAVNSERFSKALDAQMELLEKIEDKLHELLNKRTPAEDKPQEAKQMSDFVSAICFRVDRLENNNMWLERILEHLKLII